MKGASVVVWSVVVAWAMSAGSAAYGAAVQGSINLFSFGAQQNTGNLNTSWLFDPQSYVTDQLLTGSSRTGDFLSVPLATLVATDTLDLTNLTSWTCSGAGFGSFVTLDGNYQRPQSDFAQVTLDGVFTPDFGALDPSLAVMRISLNGTDNVSFGATTTMEIVGSPVPVPAAVWTGLFLLGALSTISFCRRAARA